MKFQGSAPAVTNTERQEERRSHAGTYTNPRGNDFTVGRGFI